MKILKITSAILLFTCTTHAQITKGNWMVGGYANFTNSSTESKYNGVTSESKGSGLLISPTIGYFVANNFVCGLSPSFGLSILENRDNITSYGIGPFARYYFLKPEKMFNILTQVNYYYGNSSTSSKSNNIGFKAGPVVYFNSSVGLEFTIDYSISKSSTSSNESTNRGLNVGFGLQIHLKK